MDEVEKAHPDVFNLLLQVSTLPTCQPRPPPPLTAPTTANGFNLLLTLPLTLPLNPPLEPSP